MDCASALAAMPRSNRSAAPSRISCIGSVPGLGRGDDGADRYALVLDQRLLPGMRMSGLGRMGRDRGAITPQLDQQHARIAFLFRNRNLHAQTTVVFTDARLGFLA